MAVRWRWDQGRLDYFSFGALRSMARVLASLDGVRLDARLDPLRDRLEAAVGLPFLPGDYRVWRNYGRVIEAALLATAVDNRLVCTQLGKAVANQGRDMLTADDYLLHVARTWYLPSPVFRDYAPRGERVFPFCAMIRWLLAGARGGTVRLSVEKVFSQIAGNNCTGTEPLSHYAALPVTARRGAGDEVRQVREMMAFISQLSFLTWDRSELVLAVGTSSPEAMRRLGNLFEPRESQRNPDRPNEILLLGRHNAGRTIEIPLVSLAEADDGEFTEGRKVRRTHLGLERHPGLRRRYFEEHGPPYVCDLCALEAKLKYPWVENLLEVHHVMPLASAVRVGKAATRLDDLVPLCPNCHRAVHKYYRLWLDGQHKEDFMDRDEAVTVYADAKAAAA